MPLRLSRERAERSKKPNALLVRLSEVRQPPEGLFVFPVDGKAGFCYNN